MSNTTFYRVVGIVVALASLGALFINPNFAWVSLLFGLHLLQHTFTKFCLLQKVLNKK